jgi:hypothetical protein
LLFNNLPQSLGTRMNKWSQSFMFLFSEDNYITPHQTIHFFFLLEW